METRRQLQLCWALKDKIRNKIEEISNTLGPVFPKVSWNWMDILSSNGVRITGLPYSLHDIHTPQRRCSDSCWSFCPVMNNLLLAYKRNHPAMKQKEKKATQFWRKMKWDISQPNVVCNNAISTKKKLARFFRNGF